MLGGSPSAPSNLLEPGMAAPDRRGPRLPDIGVVAPVAEAPVPAPTSIGVAAPVADAPASAPTSTVVAAPAAEAPVPAPISIYVAAPVAEAPEPAPIRIIVAAPAYFSLCPMSETRRRLLFFSEHTKH